MRKKAKIPNYVTRDHILELDYSSVRKYARHWKVGDDTAKQILEKYNIVLPDGRKKKSDNKKPSKKELQEYYYYHSIPETCKKYNVGRKVLLRWLDSYDIAVKQWGLTNSIKHQKRITTTKPSKKELKENYKKKSIHELSKEYNVDKGIVRGWLHEIGVETQTHPSRKEKELFEWCYNLDNSFVSNDRTVIKPKELDIFSEKFKLAIEYCGSYWHSNSVIKDKKYHQNKYLACRAKGVDLITVFETDDIEKVKQLILRKIGRLQNKVFARKTEIKEISSKTAKEFFDRYHLSNGVYASVNLGLFLENELVMAVSFSKSRFSKKYQWECIRMSSKNDTVVIGGASKLFKYFMKNWKPESCVSYADCRFGSGQTYEHCGFTNKGITGPNYWYVFGNEKIESRVKYQKHKLEKLFPEHFDKNLTEEQIMLDAGYRRIFDCGNVTWCCMYNHT